MRSLHIMVTTSLLAGGLIACGDDKKDEPTICTGHGDCDDAFELPEGGEIRMELNGFADGTSNINIQALFFKSQNPPRRELVGSVVEGGCEDWSAGNIFDNGDTPEAQAIADSREYIDIGNSLTVLRGNKR